MGTAYSDYLEAKILNRALNAETDTNWAVLSNVYVALFTAAPNDAGGGTEVTGGSYARVSTGPADWTVTGTGTATNANDISFPQATASWGTVTHVGIFDASSGGNLLFYGALDSSKTVNSGATAKFLAGDIDVDLDDGGSGSATTDYLEDLILGRVFDGESDTEWPQIASVHVALFTAAPGDTGGGTEVSGGSYARVQVTTGFTVNGGNAQNTSDVAFPTATANWGTVTHVGIFDASSGGNLLFYGALSQSRDVNNGAQLKFLSGQLVIDLD